MHWFENVRPMREQWKMDNREYQAINSAYDIQADDEFLGDVWLDIFLTNTFLDVKYEKVDVWELATTQKHLNSEQQRDLEQVSNP